MCEQAAATGFDENERRGHQQAHAKQNPLGDGDEEKSDQPKWQAGGAQPLRAKANARPGEGRGDGEESEVKIELSVRGSGESAGRRFRPNVFARIPSLLKDHGGDEPVERELERDEQEPEGEKAEPRNFSERKEETARERHVPVVSGGDVGRQTLSGAR